MPFYIYKCQECGSDCEYFQHYTDDPITVCPECGEVALQKIYQPTAFVLKGKGWYKTDAKSRPI